MAGYGLDGLINRRVSPRAKRYLGATAYALAAVREVLRYRSIPLALRLDGEEHRAAALMLVAGNTRNYAGIVEVTPEALVDDGLLDICLYEGQGTADIVMHALRTLFKRHRHSRGVWYRRGKRLELEWRDSPPLQVDGEDCPESPAEVTVAPSALWVAVPLSFRSPLFSAGR